MSDKRFNWKHAVAEFLGVAALLAALFGYIMLMGAETVSGGAGLILMLVSIVGYLLLTRVPRNGSVGSSEKRYWIMYAAKLVLIAMLLLLAPLVSRTLAWLING